MKDYFKSYAHGEWKDIIYRWANKTGQQEEYYQKFAEIWENWYEKTDTNTADKEAEKEIKNLLKEKKEK